MTRKQYIGVYDEVYTPSYATKFLLDHFGELDLWRYGFGDFIWEPCKPRNEKSALAETIRHYFLGNMNVYSTSIDMFDFIEDSLFKNPYYLHITSIITNPPYSLKREFLEKAYDWQIPFAFLLPTEHMGTKFAGELYKEHGINVLIPNRRIDFTGKGSPHTHTSWFYWSPKLENGKMYFKELNK